MITYAYCVCTQENFGTYEKAMTNSIHQLISPHCPTEFGFNEICTSNDECLDSQLLECHNDTRLCQCNSTMFYNSTVNVCVQSKWEFLV